MLLHKNYYNMGCFISRRTEVLCCFVFGYFFKDIITNSTLRNNFEEFNTVIHNNGSLQKLNVDGII